MKELQEQYALHQTTKEGTQLPKQQILEKESQDLGVIN